MKVSNKFPIKKCTPSKYIFTQVKYNFTVNQKSIFSDDESTSTQSTPLIPLFPCFNTDNGLTESSPNIPPYQINQQPNVEGNLFLSFNIHTQEKQFFCKIEDQTIFSYIQQDEPQL